MADTNPNTANDITLATIPAADGATVTKPAPADVAAVTVDNKVSVMSIETVPVNITYTPIAVTDEVNNETLNRTAETMKADINQKMGTFAASLTAALNDLGQDASDQAVEIQSKFNQMAQAVNAGFADVRTKSATQTDDIMAIISNKVGAVMSEMGRVLEIAENSQTKIAALDDTYNTDSEFAARVQAVNDLINQMSSTDLDFFAALDAAIDELNGMVRFRVKLITVNSVNGIYPFALAAESWPEFASAADFHVEAISEVDDTKQIGITGKTGTGFTIAVKSNQVHYRPQPVDCSTNTVQVLVRVSNDGAPLSFTATRLNDASGATTTEQLGD